MDKIYIVIWEAREGTSYVWHIVGCYKNPSDAKFCMNMCAEVYLESSTSDNSIVNTYNQILINLNGKQHFQKIYLEEVICYGSN